MIVNDNEKGGEDMASKWSWAEWVALVVDVGEAVALEIAEQAIKERKRRRGRKRLKW